MIFLSHRLYRKNQRPETEAQRMRVSRIRIHENPFAVDSSACHNSPDSPSPIERHHRWGENTFSSIGDDVWRRKRHRHFSGINPGFTAHRRDLDDALDRRTYRPEPRSHPYENGPATATHSLAIIQPKAYSPFPNCRRLSQAPSSPSIYPAALPVAADDDSVHQFSPPTNIARPKNAVVLNKRYSRGTSPKRLGSNRALVDPETYTMTPLDSEDGQGYTAVSLMAPPSGGPYQLYPPSIPPKSPMRGIMPKQTDLDVSFSAPPDLRYPNKVVGDSFVVTGSRH